MPNFLNLFQPKQYLPLSNTELMQLDKWCESVANLAALQPPDASWPREDATQFPRIREPVLYSGFIVAPARVSPGLTWLTLAPIIPTTYMTAIFNEGRRTAPSAAADNDKCMAVAFQGEDAGKFGLAFQSWIADEVNHDQICEGRDIIIFWPEEFQCYQAPVAKTANNKFQKATWTRITVTVRKLGEYKSMVDKCKVLTDTKGVSSELDAAARRLASKKKYADMVAHQTIKKRSCDEGSKGCKKKRRKHSEVVRAKKGNIPSPQLVDSILASELKDSADYVEFGETDAEDECIPNTVTPGQADDDINSLSRTDLIELCEMLRVKNRELSTELDRATFLLKSYKGLTGLTEQLEAIQRHVRDAEVASSNLVARQPSSSGVSKPQQKQFLKLVEKENVDPSVKQAQLDINPALGHHSPQCFKEPHQTTYYSVSAGGITQDVVRPNTYILVEDSDPSLSSDMHYEESDDNNIISMAMPFMNDEMAKEQQDNTAISTTIPLQSAECLPKPPQQSEPVVEHDDSQVVRVPKEAPTLETHYRFKDRWVDKKLMERKQFLEDCAPPGTKKSKKKKKKTTDVDQGTSNTPTSFKDYFLFLVANCFHKYELATHSLTGTECPRVASSDPMWKVQAKAKPQLDPGVLKAIAAHLAEVFPNKDLEAEMKKKLKSKMVNSDSWYKGLSLPSQLEGARDGYVTFMSERSNPLPTLIPFDEELKEHKKIQDNLKHQSLMRRVNESSELHSL